MSVSVNVKAYSGKASAEFRKHLNAVKFCIENDLSFPKETSEFFKGKVGGGDNLEVFNRSNVIGYIENGIEVKLPTTGSATSGDGLRIKVADIPKEADEIVITLS